MALALRGNADLGHDLAAGVDAYRGGVMAGAGDAGRTVEGGAIHGRLDVGADAQTEQPAGCAGRRLVVPELVVVEYD